MLSLLYTSQVCLFVCRVPVCAVCVCEWIWWRSDTPFSSNRAQYMKFMKLKFCRESSTNSSLFSCRNQSRTNTMHNCLISSWCRLHVGSISCHKLTARRATFSNTQGIGELIFQFTWNDVKINYIIECRLLSSILTGVCHFLNNIKITHNFYLWNMCGRRIANTAFWQQKSGSLYILSYRVCIYGCYEYEMVVTFTATRMPLKGSMASPMRYDVITWKREGIHGSTANSPHKGPVTQALISSFMITK